MIKNLPTGTIYIFFGLQGQSLNNWVPVCVNMLIRFNTGIGRCENQWTPSKAPSLFVHLIHYVCSRRKKFKSKELKKQLFSVWKPINDRDFCHLLSFTHRSMK